MMRAHQVAGDNFMFQPMALIGALSTVHIALTDLTS